MPTADVATVRVRLTVAYDGTGFHGFAPNEGVATVGGTLADALSRASCGRPIELTCAGRTDAGVHGWGQVVSFDVPADRLADDGSSAALQHAVNHICAAARSSCATPTVAAPTSTPGSRPGPASTATRCSTGRCPDPFLARTTWHVERPLDLSRCGWPATR